MTTQRYFITGTDTEIGKTHVTCALLTELAAMGYHTAGLKPIAAGADVVDGQLCNSDALALQAASSVAMDYQTVNPICLPAPCSPHIAAELAQHPLRVADVPLTMPLRDLELFDAASSQQQTIALYEGAGGWYTPLNATQSFADWVSLHQLPVIVVVGLKLGCLNHAQLTVQAVQAAGLACVGWIANAVGPHMAHREANIAYLDAQLPVPRLAQCGHGEPLCLSAAGRALFAGK